MRYKERCSLNQISCTNNCQRAASTGRNFFLICAAKAGSVQGYLMWGRANPQAEFPIRQMAPEEATDDKTHFVLCQIKSKSEIWTQAKEPAACQDLYSRWAEDMEQSCHRVNGRWKRGGQRKPRHFSPCISGHLPATLPATASSPWFDSAHFAEDPTSSTGWWVRAVQRLPHLSCKQLSSPNYANSHVDPSLF